jgi:hypothetical protein
LRINVKFFRMKCCGQFSRAQLFKHLQLQISPIQESQKFAIWIKFVARVIYPSLYSEL